jgi:hypothetical protein
MTCVYPPPHVTCAGEHCSIQFDRFRGIPKPFVAREKRCLSRRRTFFALGYVAGGRQGEEDSV